MTRETVTSGQLRDAQAEKIRAGLESLLEALSHAEDRQWDSSPVPRPRDDTAQRSSGGAPSDPTADVVLDARRLELRDAVTRAENVLAYAALAFTDRLAALDRAISRFDGE